MKSWAICRFDARPQSTSSTKASCNARPDHTSGQTRCVQLRQHVLLFAFSPPEGTSTRRVGGNRAHGGGLPAAPLGVPTAGSGRLLIAALCQLPRRPHERIERPGCARRGLPDGISSAVALATTRSLASPARCARLRRRCAAARRRCGGRSPPPKASRGVLLAT